MKSKKSLMAGIFAVVMLIFALFLTAHTVLRAYMNFQIEDTRRSLETSQGRERKQQHEYDEVTAQIPLVQAELAEIQPRAEAAAAMVKELKAERKRLREEKKELEKALESAAFEDTGTAIDGEVQNE